MWTVANDSCLPCRLLHTTTAVCRADCCTHRQLSATVAHNDSCLPTVAHNDSCLPCRLLHTPTAVCRLLHTTTPVCRADCCTQRQLSADCCTQRQLSADCCTHRQLSADCCTQRQLSADCCRRRDGWAATLNKSVGAHGTGIATRIHVMPTERLTNTSARLQQTKTLKTFTIGRLPIE